MRFWTFVAFDAGGITMIWTDAIAKGSRAEDAWAVDPTFVVADAPSWDAQAETDVFQAPEAEALGVTLSGHGVTVDHGNVCDLLAGCLWDVCFITLTLCVFVFTVLFLTLICSSIGCFFNKGCWEAHR
jgi:hypothetical protein